MWSVWAMPDCSRDNRDWFDLSACFAISSVMCGSAPGRRGGAISADASLRRGNGGLRPGQSEVATGGAVDADEGPLTHSSTKNTLVQAKAAGDRAPV